jgi:hypothetical protein
MKAEARHGKIVLSDFPDTYVGPGGVTTSYPITREQALELMGELAEAYQMSGDMCETNAVTLRDDVNRALIIAGVRKP